ncbi:hypothetical protein [Methylobacterium iners]|uniref:Uncharacterized protein n=1 Tax=Methylobacterium iners TaxID=418707 RepID=A0ABQ4RS37_9HYPH|nr:hypothetical protein [Methylobacterium iners]GJD93590.1 hypothetical protein OCOJLMKI_0786 [Methylobacterium iners]
MTRIRAHLDLRRSLAVVTTAGLMLGAGSTVGLAQDGGGGLFQRLFSPAPHEQAVQPASPLAATIPQARTLTWREYAARRSATRESQRRRPSIRYAALPKPKSEPLKIRISDRSDRQVPLDMSRGAAAALLKDPTLRPGDIVVLKDGARVFTGQPNKLHSVKDFESIGRSEFVDRRTRALLSALVVPIGAMTPAEAKKQMAVLKAVPSLIAAPAPLQTAGIRVIYPGPINP